MNGPFDKRIPPKDDPDFWEKVRRAREMPDGEKLMAGPRMFDEWAAKERACIQAEHPEFTDEQVMEEFRRQLRVQKEIDEAGFYRDAGYITDE